MKTRRSADPVVGREPEGFPDGGLDRSDGRVDHQATIGLHGEAPAEGGVDQHLVQLLGRRGQEPQPVSLPERLALRADDQEAPVAGGCAHGVRSVVESTWPTGRPM